MEWAWSLSETVMNTYCKLLSKCNFREVITRPSDHFVTLVYEMIFKHDPPCMSKSAMEALIDIADWYASLFDTFIRMFTAEKHLHALLKFSLDILLMQEVVCHISIGLIARLHRKKKPPWPTLPLKIGLYKIQSFKKADVKAE